MGSFVAGVIIICTYGVHNGLTTRRPGLQEKHWSREYNRARTDGSTASAKIKASFAVKIQKRLSRVASISASRRQSTVIDINRYRLIIISRSWSGTCDNSRQ